MALQMTGKLGIPASDQAPRLRQAAQKMKGGGATKPTKTISSTQRNASVLGAVSGGRATGPKPKPANTGKLY